MHYKSKLKLFMAGMVLALVFTFFGCSGDDGDTEETDVGKQSSSSIGGSGDESSSSGIGTEPSSSSDDNNETFETFTDSRDGKKYKIKDIGDGAVWFLEDLAYNSKKSYTWSEAITACPTGWHLPSNAEWNSLEEVWAANKADFSAYRAGDWWSATEFGNDGTLGYHWKLTSGNLFRFSNIQASQTCSVRCVKD